MNFFKTLLILLALSTTGSALAKEKYPPIFFYSPIEKDFFMEKIKQENAFEAVDKDIIGRPIGVDIAFGRETKLSAVSASSLILAAGTLGLTPVSSEFVFKVRISLLAHGTIVMSSEFELPRKEVQNIWTAKSFHELRDDEKEFAVNAIPKFLQQVKTSPEAINLFKEYNTYFGNP